MGGSNLWSRHPRLTDCAVQNPTTQNTQRIVMQSARFEQIKTLNNSYTHSSTQHTPTTSLNTLYNINIYIHTHRQTIYIAMYILFKQIKTRTLRLSVIVTKVDKKPPRAIDFNSNRKRITCKYILTNIFELKRL